MMHKKHGKHKPKDILALTLKNLLVDEGFFCTNRTYDKIRDRIDAFKRSCLKGKYVTRPWGAVVNIKRVA
jgi:hypothetical protein